MSKPGTFPEFLRATIAKAEHGGASKRDVHLALRQHELSLKRIAGSTLDLFSKEVAIEEARTSIIATLETFCDTELPYVPELPAIPEVPELLPPFDLPLPDDQSRS